MALFMDGSISELEDLVAQDSQLLTVANAEQIDVTQKMALAREEIGLELITMLNRLRFVEQPFWVTAQPSLGGVVVTKALKLWHTYRALEMVYSDAFNSQLNDRYGAKRDQFRESAHESRETLIQIGVGIVSHPVPRAKPPQLVAVPGSLPDGLYYVTMAWLNSSCDEGASAVPAPITLSASALQVQPGSAPPVATNWNVYAGTAPEALVLQNNSPIPAGQIWIQTAPLVSNGPHPGRGQEPNHLKPIPRVLPRG